MIVDSLDAYQRPRGKPRLAGGGISALIRLRLANQAAHHLPGDGPVVRVRGWLQVKPLRGLGRVSVISTGFAFNLRA